VRLAMVQCGCTMNNALIQHMFVALPVIPELRLTDMGLVDVTKFGFVDLFV
jgi:adenine deaminase